MPYMKVERGFVIEGFYTPCEYFWDDKFVFDGESHSGYEVVFVGDGEIQVTEDENVYVLGRNDIIFHAPGEFHRIKSHGGTHPHVYVASFEVSGELPTRLEDGVFRLRDGEAAEYVSNLKRIMELRRGSDEDYLAEEAAAGLSLFFVRLAKRGADSVHSSSVSALEYKRLVSSMTDCISNNASLDDFAAENNVSVSYIKYLFSKYAGVSPKKYYTALRIRRAEELLREGYSVNDIVSLMNFSSPAYFSMFFKRETGKSPTEYTRYNK